MTTLPRPRLGWPLLPLPDVHGRLEWPSLEASIRDQIRVILSTRPGEQLMRPDFGAGLDRMAFEPNTLATRRAIRDQVHAALNRWEPRILLDRVEVMEVEGEPTHIRVEIGYRLARDGTGRTVAVAVQAEG